MSLTHRLQQMDAALERGLQSPGEDYLQRQMLQDILRHAFLAGVAPLDYLRQKLQPAPVVPSVAAPEGYRCTHPDCAGEPPFRTQMALNGHKRKHSKSQTS